MFVFSIVMAATFELARAERVYDYLGMVKLVLGPAWPLFEIAYLLIILLVLAVVSSAAAIIFADRLLLDPTSAALIFPVLVLGLLLLKRSALESAFSFWSVLIYCGYIALFVATFSLFGNKGIPADGTSISANSIFSGIKYAGYNLAAIPAVLFVLGHQTRRRQAILSGLLAGPIAMIPAVLLFFAMALHYPAILSEPIPLTLMLEKIGSPTFALIMEIIILGTFFQTAIGFLNSINERVDGAFKRSGYSALGQLGRAAVGVVVLGIAKLITLYAGLIELIANGYGTLTYAFLLLFALPVVTMGVWRIFRRGQSAQVSPTATQEDAV